MKLDISNKVLEDILFVLTENMESKDDDVISDKSDHIVKKNGYTTYPFILSNDNPYKEIEIKVLHYMNNINKYHGLGIDNIEQYLLLVNLHRKKLYGTEKRTAIYIQDYVKNRNDYIKMGFYKMSEFITYREYLNRYGDYKKAAYLYSTEKEYEKVKDDYKLKGVYSLDEYRIFSKIMDKSLKAFDRSELYKELSFKAFLDFELREFIWKREFFEKQGSLKGVGVYVREKYSTPQKILQIDEYPYFKEPEYYYKNNKIRTFGELYEYYEKLIKTRHKFSSEKPESDYLDYMLKNIRG